MITSFVILPHPSLQPFVDSYLLCTSHGNKITLKSAWPASNETSFVFYMADQPSHQNDDGKISKLQSSRGCLVGLQSYCNGIVSFYGVYYTFIISCKANGLNKLFRLPAIEMVNKIHYLDDVFGDKINSVTRQLHSAKDIQEMACCADMFLLSFLDMQPNYINLRDGITFIANELSKQTSLLSIEQYAYKANMSVRNFGRRFIEQTGVSPKLYCRLLRFNNAGNKKIRYPQINWTSIAYECGYYDQMHLIKDFKEFANTNPTQLFQKNTEFTRPHNEVTGYNVSDFSDMNGNLINEKFVFVERTGYSNY